MTDELLSNVTLPVILWVPLVLTTVLSTWISFAFAVIPEPPTTFNVLVADRLPPPVKPVPATISLASIAVLNVLSVPILFRLVVTAVLRFPNTPAIVVALWVPLLFNIPFVRPISAFNAMTASVILLVPLVAWLDNGATAAPPKPTSSCNSLRANLTLFLFVNLVFSWPISKTPPTVKAPDISPAPLTSSVVDSNSPVTNTPPLTVFNLVLPLYINDVPNWVIWAILTEPPVCTNEIPRPSVLIFKLPVPASSI